MSQPAVEARQTRDLKEEPRRTDSLENLALLYEGLLTGIVRLQARRQHIRDGQSFRRRTKATLDEVERTAISAGYDGNDVQETHFAVVAFLDSVVLHLDDPVDASVRSEWERKSLQEELFGQTDAGVVFFEKLDRFRSRRDSGHLADILEVYLLCLLLGFEGRYSGGLRAELESVTEKLRMRIDDIRGPRAQISPSGGVPSDLKPPPISESNRLIDPLRWAALAALIFTVSLFLVLKINLVYAIDQALRTFP